MKLEDTVPATSTLSAPADAEVTGQGTAVSYAAENPAADPAPRPTTRGGYPNLNIRPATANAQLTEAERSASTSQLEAARQRVNEEDGAPVPVVENAEQVRRFAREREEETLRRIEAR